MFNKENLLEKSKTIIPVLYLVSLTSISVFGALYGRKGFCAASVFSLIISVIAIIVTVLYYTIFYEDNETYLKATEFYYNMTNLNSLTIKSADGNKRVLLNPNEEQVANYKMSGVFREYSLSHILKVFNDIIMPNLLILGNSNLGPSYIMYFFSFTSLNENEILSFDEIVSDIGNDSISICDGTGYLNITKLMVELLSIITVDFHTSLDYDENTNKHKLVVVENSEEYLNNLNDSGLNIFD